MAAKNIINLAEASRPDFTERQREFAGKLIGMGLTRLTIIGLVVGKDVSALNHAEINGGMKLIEAVRKEQGYGVMDARRAHSPFMADAVLSAAKSLRIQVRIA